MYCLFKHHLKFCCIVWIIFSITNITYAQRDSIVREKYVYDVTNSLAISLFNRNPDNSVNINFPNKLVQLNPNDPNTIGIKALYKWFGLGVGILSKPFDISTRGKTERLDLNLFSYGIKNGFNLYYIFYQGYYLSNAKSFDTLANTGKIFPLYPDLTTQNIGLNFYHIFNHKKHSIRAVYNYNEIQTKSSGSFILNGSLSYFNIYGYNSFLAKEISQNINQSLRFTSGNFYALSILPGYSHTFVIGKHLFFNLNFSYGAMFQLQNYETEQAKIKDRMNISPRAIGKLSLGYNHKRFFIGLQSQLDSYNYPLNKDLNISFNIKEARLSLGYRFNIKPESKLNKVTESVKALFRL